MEKLERNTLLNKASIAGAIFGLISGSYIFINYAIAGMGGMALGIISTLLWLAKFIGCILLMRFFMKKLVDEFSDVKNSDTLKFGLLTALFSAIITAAAGYVATAYVFPDLMNEQIDQMYQIYGKYLDSNSMSMVDSMMESYPTITFFSQLIWCFIYGAVLSFILSGKIPAQDPFKDYRNEDSDAE